MRRVIIALFIISNLSIIEIKAGHIPFFYSYGETIDKVLNLPNTETFEFEYGDGLYHGDLGVKYNQFCLFWIPLFNYGEKRYVLFNKRKDDYIYVVLDYNDIKYLQEEYGSSMIPTSPKLSFWNEWGGKILGLFILLLGWIFIKSYSKEETKILEDN